MGRADVGGRRHRRHVGGQRDHGARRCAPGALGRDVHHHRNLGVENRLDDVAGGTEQSAGGIQLDDEAFRAGGGCLVDGRLDKPRRPARDGLTHLDHMNRPRQMPGFLPQRGEGDVQQHQGQQAGQQGRGSHGGFQGRREMAQIPSVFNFSRHPNRKARRMVCIGQSFQHPRRKTHWGRWTIGPPSGNDVQAANEGGGRPHQKQERQA